MKSAMQQGMMDVQPRPSLTPPSLIPLSFFPLPNRIHAGLNANFLVDDEKALEAKYGGAWHWCGRSRH